MKPAAIAVWLAFLFSAFDWSSAAGKSVSCQNEGRLVLLPGLWEASGVSVSTSSPDRLWIVNDSGPPVVFSVDGRGQIIGRAQIARATVDDWEDLTTGRCPQGQCLFIGDIGDNLARRSHVTVYRIGEPQSGTVSTVAAEAFHATYPDGAHNAESLFVDDRGRIFIVTKGRTASLYRFPPLPAPDSTSKLEKVADLPIDEPATGAALSPDRTWVAIRSNHAVWFFSAKELAGGMPGEPLRADVSAFHEPQGEGVAFGADGRIVLVGEGGSKGRPGTLTTATCTLPR